MIVKLDLSAESLSKRSEQFRLELAEICEDEAFLNELAKDSSVKVRCQVAQNYITSKKTLKKLALDPDYRVRESVARTQNPNCDREIKEILLQDPDTTVRVALAESCEDEATLWEMLKDVDSVKNGITKNPKATSDMLDELVEILNANGRINIMQHINTSDATLEKLAKDPDIDVRATMASWPGTRRKFVKLLAKDTESHIKRTIARRTDLDEETLNRLANDPDPWVRRDIAANTIATKQILTKLSKDPRAEVRRAVGGNVKTTSEILDGFTSETDIATLLAVIQHHNVAKKTLETLKFSNFAQNNRVIKDRVVDRLHHMS